MSLFFPLASFSLHSAVYLLAALLPAALLMYFIYRHDLAEKEPPRLLAKLVLFGCIAGIVAIALELFGERFLHQILSPKSPFTSFLLTFCVVAVVEEGLKLLFLRKTTWDDPAFDYKFDAVVYAAFLSLGFAAFENVGYIFRYGLSIAMSRALLAVPAHLGFSVFMGIFYGLAKQADLNGEKSLSKRYFALSYAVPILLHGFYDSCCLADTTLSKILLLAFMAALYVIVVQLVKHESNVDRPLQREFAYGDYLDPNDVILDDFEGEDSDLEGEAAPEVVPEAADFASAAPDEPSM